MNYDHNQSVREIIKHVMFRCGFGRLVDARRHALGQPTDQIYQTSVADVFSQVYAKRIWAQGGNDAILSGSGSTELATKELRAQLEAFLKEVGCQKFVDIGCGDFNWMRNVDGDFEYLGIDVVPELIDAHRANYGSATRSFLCMDAIQSKLPSGDVALCREVIFHLSLRDGLQVLRNIKSAGFKYVLLTSDTRIWFNSDIRTGDFRRINLSKPPFSLVKSVRELRDDKMYSGRVLAVWHGSDLPN